MCATPVIANAIIPFGGPVLPWICPADIPGVCSCQEGGKFAIVGPPNPGAFVWGFFTRNYSSGVPQLTGQYVLGMATIPYYCIASLFPVTIYTGLYVSFAGSSGLPASKKKSGSSAPASQWLYPQFTSGAEYDAEIVKLDAEYDACVKAAAGECNQKILLVSVRNERHMRFGLSPTQTAP